MGLMKRILLYCPPGQYKGLNELPGFAFRKGPNAINTWSENIDDTASDAISEKSATVRATQPKPTVYRRGGVFSEKLSTLDLENLDIGLCEHRPPRIAADSLAFWYARYCVSYPLYLFTGQRLLNRSLLLQILLSIPGIVGALLRHLRSIRRLSLDFGWIFHLLDESENQRMLLFVWLQVTKPLLSEQIFIPFVIVGFALLYVLVYAISPHFAHRLVGYLGEEALKHYTELLQALDSRQIPNEVAPGLAIEYWNLPTGATLRDVVLAIRVDQAIHRDVNHHFSDRLYAMQEDLNEPFGDEED